MKHIDRDGANENPGESVPGSKIFTVRLWSEALGDDQTEWRGQVRYLRSGETGYFREWSTLVAFMEKILTEQA